MSYLSKVTDLNLLHLHLAHLLWVTPFEFCQDLWYQRTRADGLSCSIVCVILCLAILVEHELVMDRQTDRQTTYDDGIYHASTVSRSKNGAQLRKR